MSGKFPSKIPILKFFYLWIVSGPGQIFLTQIGWLLRSGSATSGFGKFSLKDTKFFSFSLLGQKKSCWVISKMDRPFICWGSKVSSGWVRSGPISTFGSINPWLKQGHPHILEMGPDPTRAYFWPAVNKRPTWLWPGYFLTWPKAIFFDPRGKKLKNLTFLGEIFEIQTQAINGWPNPTQATKNWPDPTWVKNFGPGPITTIFTSGQ